MENELSGLECGLCCEDYTSGPGRRPKLLHGCGHTVCEQCCATLCGETRLNQLICPFDRIATSLSDHTPASLNKNYALLELIEKKRSENIISPQEPMMKTNFVMPFSHLKDFLLGIPCDEDPNHTSLYYCIVCASHLCAECSERTHAGRVLSKHTRVLVSEKPVPRPMCPYHSTYALEFVCMEIQCLSKNRLMCLLCRDYGRHKNHGHSLLEVEASEFRKFIKEPLNGFQKFITGISACTRNVHQVVTEITDPNEGSHGAARRQVSAHFQSLHSELNTQEQVALAHLEAHVSDRIDILRKHQQEFVEITSQVSSIIAHLQRGLELDDARLMEKQVELVQMLDTVRSHRLRLASVPFTVSAVDSQIPFSFTVVNRINMGSTVDMRLVILGLDGAGKTSVLSKLKNEQFRHSAPTIGFNVETLQYKNFKLTLWDVGGAPRLRPLWKHYYLNTQALIFIIDTSSPHRFLEARTELDKILAERDLVDTSFLIILNRKRANTDEPCDSDSSAIDCLVMNLNRIVAGRSVLVHQCNALTGVGLWEALDALTSLVMSRISVNELARPDQQASTILEP